MVKRPMVGSAGSVFSLRNSPNARGKQTKGGLAPQARKHSRSISRDNTSPVRNDKEQLYQPQHRLQYRQQQQQQQRQQVYDNMQPNYDDSYQRDDDVMMINPSFNHALQQQGQIWTSFETPKPKEKANRGSGNDARAAAGIRHSENQKQGLLLPPPSRTSAQKSGGQARGSHNVELVQEYLNREGRHQGTMEQQQQRYQYNMQPPQQKQVKNASSERSGRLGLAPNVGKLNHASNTTFLAPRSVQQPNRVALRNPNVANNNNAIAAATTTTTMMANANNNRSDNNSQNRARYNSVNSNNSPSRQHDAAGDGRMTYHRNQSYNQVSNNAISSSSRSRRGGQIETLDRFQQHQNLRFNSPDFNNNSNNSANWASNTATAGQKHSLGQYAARKEGVSVKVEQHSSSNNVNMQQMQSSDIASGDNMMGPYDDAMLGAEPNSNNTYLCPACGNSQVSNMLRQSATRNATDEQRDV